MGDVNRITKTFMDTELSKIFTAIDSGKFKPKKSPFFLRPAYAYTKAAVGGINDEDLSRVNHTSDV